MARIKKRKKAPQKMKYWWGWSWKKLEFMCFASAATVKSGMVLSQKCGFVKNFGYEILKK